MYTISWQVPQKENEMGKLKFGIIGTGRGSNFIGILKACGAELVAYCENDEFKKKNLLKYHPEVEEMLYEDYDEFLKCEEMDAVILANYFCDHAEFAMKAMRAGKHVLSETISNITMAEGVELCRCVEETGKVYALLENYPYQKANLAMEKLYKSGKLGKIVYGEGEYVHPMSRDEQNSLARGKYHWRNWTPRTYYTTHALAPIMQMTDCMPKRITAMASFAPEVAEGTALNTGDAAAIIMVQTDNDAVFRINGWSMFAPHGSHYRLCCTKGGVEMSPTTEKMRITYNHWSKPEDVEEAAKEYDYYWPDESLGKFAEEAGHGGSDFWVVYYFVKALENGEEPYWNVYRATAMASVAILSWRSILNGNIPYDIPDFRREEDRKLYENDRVSPFPDENGNVDVRCSSIPYAPSEEDMKSAEEHWSKME